MVNSSFVWEVGLHRLFFSFNKFVLPEYFNYFCIENKDILSIKWRKHYYSEKNILLMHRIRSRNTKHSKFLWWTKYFRNVLNFWQCYPFRGYKWGSGRKRKQIMPHMLGGEKKTQLFHLPWKSEILAWSLKVAQSQKRRWRATLSPCHPLTDISELMLQTHSAGSSCHTQARQGLAWLLPAGVQIQRWIQTVRVITMQ